MKKDDDGKFKPVFDLITKDDIENKDDIDKSGGKKKKSKLMKNEFDELIEQMIMSCKSKDYLII